MSSHNQFVFEGLEELKAALRQLPEELAREAAFIVEANAQAAKTEIDAGYRQHTRSGNLAGHTYVSHRRDGVSVGATVKNTAKHAWLFENGSQARHTDLGANRGAMPPGHVFIPIMQKQRRVMYQVLKDLLVTHGLVVSGDAG